MTQPQKTRTVSVGAALVGMLLAWLITAPAAAHTNPLASSTPAAGSIVRSVDSIELKFVTSVKADATTFTLRARDGANQALATPTFSADRTTVTLPMSKAVPDGRYRIGYQMILSDGDPVAGVVEFEVSSDGVARAPAWPENDPPPLPPKQRIDAGSGLSWVIGIGVALLIVTVILLLRPSRRTEADEPANASGPTP